MTRGTVGALPALAWVTALTTWITLLPWRAFAENGAQHMGTLLFCIAAVTTAGMLCRMARLPVIVVASAQLLTVMLSANLIWGDSLIPTQGSIEAVITAFADAVAAANEFAAPVPADASSIGPIIVLGGLALHVLVDLLAVTLGRVPVSGLPLLAAYSLPISMLDREVGWLTFALAATGFLGMLALQENDRVNRWGRALLADDDIDRSGFSVRAGGQHPAALGAWAIVTALLLPILIPTFDLASLPGPGGEGGGGNKVVLENPLVDMREDIAVGRDIPAVRVVTPDPDPSYLRMAVLSEFTEEAWRPGEHLLAEDQTAEGPMPRPVGLDLAIPTTEEPWEVETLEGFKSLWLPTPMRVASIDAGEDFRYDAETLDFHHWDDNAHPSTLSYSLTELDVTLTAEMLSLATGVPGPVRDRFTDLPGDLPPIVEETAEEVTAGLTTQYDQAVAIQRFFRENYEYTLDGDEGSGEDALEKFLSPGGRAGYCEQFAAAMAAMARSIDIPARVAVGFLDAKPVKGLADTWEFSTRDLHAWPELYFEGIGWVLFEPTPSVRTNAAPEYTRGLGSGGPTNAPTTQTTGPTETQSVRDPNESQDPQDLEDTASGDDQAEDDSILLPVLGIGALVLVLVGLLAATPRWLRRRRTARRWADASIPAETAWAELRDATIDLGLSWPAGRSPRAAGRSLVRSFAAPLSPDSPVRPQRGPETNPEATEALDSIVAALEVSRYAPPGPVPGEVEEMQAATGKVVGALRAGVSEGARRRAEWWPTSLLRSRRERVSATAISELERSGDGLVDSLR